ncbi:MAG: hypothetical protein NXI24_01625 [bacterium]|nr:hypothetical protein [bacterium]
MSSELTKTSGFAPGGVAKSFAASLQWLAAIFRGPEAAARGFLRSDQGSALHLFLFYHAPLLAIFPLAGLLCPAVHLGFGRFSFALQIVAPLVLVIGALLFAAIFDQIARFAQHPRMEASADEVRAKNLALFLHLPLSATGIFFLFHPVLGFLMLLAALAYCLWISIEVSAIYYERSRARVLVYMINAALLGIVPLALMTFLGNLLRNISYIQKLL